MIFLIFKLLSRLIYLKLKNIIDVIMQQVVHSPYLVDGIWIDSFLGGVYNILK